MSCRAVRELLDRDREALSEAERLVLEDHLVGCENCRFVRDQLLLMRRVGASPIRSSIGPRGYQRAIARALIEGSSTTHAASASPRRTFIAAGAAVAAAGVAVALIVSVRSGDVEEAPDPPVAMSPEHPSGLTEVVTQNVAKPAQLVEPEVAVIGGSLVHGSAVIALNSNVPTDVKLRASTTVRLRAFSVSVVVAASSEIRRPSIERAIILDRGQLELDGTSSRVIAHRFSVDAEGALTITSTRVAVKRGVARVRAPDGQLLANVEAGQVWELPESGTPVKASAATLLDQARASFTNRDFARAEKHADAALDASPTRAQAAEARTVLAECAHVAGRLDEAVERYDAIATRFADLPAGETALFAAARIEVNRKRTDAARERLQRYLDRYPSGRFADDARRQLRGP